MNSLLTEIASLLAVDQANPSIEILLYARFGANSVAPSIFENQTDHIAYRRPDLNILGDALLDLWYSEEPDKRWTEMEYLVHDGKFDVAYTYANEAGLDEDRFEHRDRIVRRYFGSKPIIYPPFAIDDDEGLQFDL